MPNVKTEIPPAPRRAVYAEITIGGDTRQDVVRNLREILELVNKGCNSSVSGGYSCCHTLTVSTDPEMSHLKFVELLEVHLEAVRAAESVLA